MRPCIADSPFSVKLSLYILYTYQGKWGKSGKNQGKSRENLEKRPFKIGRHPVLFLKKIFKDHFIIRLDIMWGTNDPTFVPKFAPIFVDFQCWPKMGSFAVMANILFGELLSIFKI